MAPDEVIKGETDENEARQLLNDTSRDEALNSLISLPNPTGTTLQAVDSDPRPTEGAGSTLHTRPCPCPAPNSLPELEMKPIFVPSPWPTYLTLPKQPYSDFVTAADINYTPQAALEQALLMLQTVENCIRQLKMHTELRKIMWRKKISELKTYNHGFITIAICGGTGAGKSSLINAVLDAHILPTSDSKACTSAIVEVRYHRHPFYSAEVEFFTRSEWGTEIGMLGDDVRTHQSNPDGDIQFDPEFIAHLKAAWQKWDALYPSLSRETLGAKKPDDIIDSDPDTACVLGSKEMIEGGTPTEFRNKLASFITAKSGTHPQLWPLVKRVRVYVKCAALESGSRLVDLPGTGDVNEARNNIAKGYLKEADYIWIVAPIKRAADESAANDLIDENLKTNLRHNKYDHRHVAFIATGTDHVSEREIIESLDLHQDANLLEIQSELAGISEALKQGKNEAHTLAGEVEVSRLEKRRTELKKKKKRTLAGKRNEHMKKVLQEKFRTGIVELESNPHSHNPSARTRLIGMSERQTPDETKIRGSTGSNSDDVPVFTCSSYDYVSLNMEDGDEPVCFNQAEDTEIPRLQHFCYDLALPAQRKPVLRVFQGLEKFLCRLREFGTNGSHSYADKLILANKWESDIPSVDGQTSFLSILDGTSGDPDSLDETPKPTLRSVLEQVTRLNATDTPNRGFSYQVHQAMKKVTEECVIHLKQEIRGALEELFLKGAAEAEAKALATHDLFAPRVTHWATYRATLRRHGEFRRNLNEELVAPITRKQLEIWPQTFKKRLLAPMANDAKLQIERVLDQVKQSSPPAIYTSCERQCQLALQEAHATINEIERGLMKLIVREQRALSRFLAPAIKEILGAAYREAIEIRGRKSTELQKNLFRGHVDTLCHTMFAESVTRWMEKLDYIPNAIGLILPTALGEVACQAEVNLASLWHMPEVGKVDVEKRKEFIRETDNILRQARLWLTRMPME